MCRGSSLESWTKDRFLSSCQIMNKPGAVDAEKMDASDRIDGSDFLWIRTNPPLQQPSVPKFSAIQTPSGEVAELNRNGLPKLVEQPGIMETHRQSATEYGIPRLREDSMDFM